MTQYEKAVALYSEVIVFDLLHDSYIVKEVNVGTRDDICSQTNEYIENCERLQQVDADSFQEGKIT